MVSYRSLNEFIKLILHLTKLSNYYVDQQAFFKHQTIRIKYHAMLNMKLHAVQLTSKFTTCVIFSHVFFDFV